jgi:hypothetical protein
VIDRKMAKVTDSFVMPGAARMVKALCLSADGKSIVFPTDRGTLCCCPLSGSPVASATFKCASGPTFYLGLISPDSVLQITESTIA